MSTNLTGEKFQLAKLASQAKIAAHWLISGTYTGHPEDSKLVGTYLLECLPDDIASAEQEYHLLIDIENAAWHLCEKHGSENADFWRNALSESVYKYRAFAHSQHRDSASIQ